jgi:ribose transport system permease protein
MKKLDMSKLLDDAGHGERGNEVTRPKDRVSFTQEKTVALIAISLFLLFSALLPGFSTPENLLDLVRSVSILGILGIGLAITILGRGIDLSMVTTMAMSVTWVLHLIQTGHSISAALSLGLFLVICIGLLNGWLIAYAEVPALFATLAMGTVVYGFVRMAFVDVDLISLPDNASWLRGLAARDVLGVPAPVLAFAFIAVLAHLFLQHLSWGLFIRGMGDNPLKARISGIPTRPMMVLQYVISAAISFFAGIVLATLVGTMNTRLVNSGMMYDVVLVAVLGGVVLNGGRGDVFHVVVGTLLVGLLLNGMTILDISYAVQNLLKGCLLLLAILIDSLLDPRDEQTSQQGDI